MRIYYIIRFVIFTILAVLIGVFSHQLLEYLDYLVGGVMLIFGLGGLFFPIYEAIPYSRWSFDCYNICAVI